MYRAVVLLVALTVGACDRSSSWSDQGGYYGSGGGYSSGGGSSWPSERTSYSNPYQGGSSCTYQGGSGSIKGARAYDRNRCCIDTPAGRSCQ